MDKVYWQQYYKQDAAPHDPSRFAQFVGAEYFKPGGRVIELGCGNGRDALYLAGCGIDVTAVDQAITDLDNGRPANPRFVGADFTRLDDTLEQFDGVYSRFTLHSVTSEEQDRVLEWANRALKIGGYLCVEVRGLRNGIYGLGDPVEGEPDAFVYDNHYRRFVDRGRLDAFVSGIGMRVVLSVENRGFAPFEGVDDYFIRHISQKVS